MFNWLVKPAFAAPVDISTTFGPAKDFSTVGTLINVLLPNFLMLAGVVTLIIIVVSGLKTISHAGAGEGEKAAKDKQAFTASLIGLIIIFGAYFFLQIVGKLVGYDFLNPQLSP